MYSHRGKVRKGNQRGKDLGFPTANVALHKTIPEGIYISETKYQDKHYPSLTFIGSAKTFNESLYQSETYLMDVSINLYNQWISIKLIKKIRGNQKFHTVEALIEQMERDKQKAREYFVK